LKVLDIGPGDEVIVPPRTFIATASSVALQGACPVFADIDPKSQNITPESIEQVITDRTKAIMPVHLAGWPCQMDGINDLAIKHGLWIIEDCAQAHGAEYAFDEGRSAEPLDILPEQSGVRKELFKPVGSFGHLACFSFCQDKIISTGGEGGMLVTNDPELFDRAWSYKDHGKSRQAVFNREHPPGFRWLHESFGTNLRLTEMQAAIGRQQLQKLPEWVASRRRNASFLNENLRDIPGLRLTEPGYRDFHSYYKYYCFLQPNRLQPEWSRERIMQAIDAEGVPCQSGSCSEVYLEKAFAAMAAAQPRLPVARELGETSLMFQVHPTLEERDMQDYVSAVKKVMQFAAL
jgi:hypothetical protein